MELPVTRHADVAVLHVAGRLDLGLADAFRTALTPHLGACVAGGDGIVLDLAGVDYISSAGLRVLMLAARQAKAQGGAVAVAALQPVVREIFEIAKFTLVLPCFGTVAEALRWLATQRTTAPGGT